MEARAATLETGIWGQNRGTISGNSQLGRVGITNFLRRGGWSWRPGIVVRLVWYGPGGSWIHQARWDEYGPDNKRLPGATSNC